MAVDITPTSDGGVLKEILTPGEGLDTAPKGCTVNAHYHGTLTDGTVFDSSVDRGQPFQFVLGKGSVIKAWDLGVATMKKGEKARLTCKSQYAYGDSGSPPKIPGGATLIFDIELLSWQEEDLSKAKDGGILRSVVEDGRGVSTPAEFRECKVHVKGTHDGRVFDDREIAFTLGEGLEHGLPRGVEKAIEKMKDGEHAKITLSPQYAWPDGLPEKNIPPGATLKYEVKLLSFEKDKESWDMDAAEKLKESELLKSRATEYFKAEKFKIAGRMYNKAVAYVESDTGFSETEDAERKKMVLTIRLNLGMVYLKLKNYYDAKNACDKALELDANNVKGLFRRGQAYLAINEPDLAKVDFEKVVQLEPNNNAAKAQMVACVKRIKEIRDKEKQIYSNMFDKLAKKDKEEPRVTEEATPN